MKQRNVLALKNRSTSQELREREIQALEGKKMAELERLERLELEKESSTQTGKPVDNRPQKPKKRAPYRPAEGHEIALATWIKNKNQVDIELLIGGGQIEGVRGRVVAFDRYTISVLLHAVDGSEVDEAESRIYFKANILNFKKVEEK